MIRLPSRKKQQEQRVGNIGEEMVKGGKITSKFSSKRDGGKRQHNALDVAAPKGTPIKMPDIGVKMRVAKVFGTPQSPGGIQVRLEGELSDGKKIEINILHIDIEGVKVEEGQEMNPGDVIVLVGNTGNTSEGKRITPWRADKKTGYHMHLQIKVGGKAIDPEKFQRQEMPVQEIAEEETSKQEAPEQESIEEQPASTDIKQKQTEDVSIVSEDSQQVYGPQRPTMEEIFKEQ